MGIVVIYFKIFLFSFLVGVDLGGFDCYCETCPVVNAHVFESPKWNWQSFWTH